MRTVGENFFMENTIRFVSFVDLRWWNLSWIAAPKRSSVPGQAGIELGHADVPVCIGVKLPQPVLRLAGERALLLGHDGQRQQQL